MGAALPLAAAACIAIIDNLQYDYVEDVNRLVMVVKADWFLVGKLNSQGVFTPSQSFDRNAANTQFPMCPLINSTSAIPRITYEFRFAGLVRGMLHPDGRFIADRDRSHDLRFSEYRPGLFAYPIWNLPGYFKIRSIRPANAGPPKEHYGFVENTDRYVVILRDDWQLIGKLNKHGDFIQEYKYAKGAPLSGGLPPRELINFPGLKLKKAYEFRSRILIPGELQPDGHFVPEVGGKIIPFKDYKYSPSAPRIWNLPGWFVPVKPPTKNKK